jgi:16S rRNA (uracil1498-N3)-methyltransferase
MRIPRIYQNLKLQSGQTVKLSDDAANHLIRVLRLPLHAELIIFDGAGHEYKAVIHTIEKKSVSIVIGDEIIKTTESFLALHLGQGISRGEKMDYTIQKAVELGVEEITPLLTERCGVQLSGERWEKRLQHWQNVAIAACEQCGRNMLPKINAPQLLMNWLSKTSADLKLVLHPHVDQQLSSSKQNPGSVCLLIGPEGGFSDSEIRLANQQGFVNLQIGPRVLRTETAAVAVLAILQSHFGDMKLIEKVQSEKEKN